MSPPPRVPPVKLSFADLHLVSAPPPPPPPPTTTSSGGGTYFSSAASPHHFCYPSYGQMPPPPPPPPPFGSNLHFFSPFTSDSPSLGPPLSVIPGASYSDFRERQPCSSGGSHPGLPIHSSRVGERGDSAAAFGMFAANAGSRLRDVGGVEFSSPGYTVEVAEEDESPPGGATCGSCFGSRSNRSVYSGKTPKNNVKRMLPLSTSSSSTYPTSPSSIPRNSPGGTSSRKFRMGGAAGDNTTPTSSFYAPVFRQFRSFCSSPLASPPAVPSYQKGVGGTGGGGGTSSPLSFFPFERNSNTSSNRAVVSRVGTVMRSGIPPPPLPPYPYPPSPTGCRFPLFSRVLASNGTGGSCTRVSPTHQLHSLHTSQPVSSTCKRLPLSSNSPPPPAAFLSSSCSLRTRHPTTSTRPSPAASITPGTTPPRTNTESPPTTSSSASSPPPSLPEGPAVALRPAGTPPRVMGISDDAVTEHSEVAEYDLQFGGVQVKLHKKLSAKCHCQFEVWEAEATAFVDYSCAIEEESRLKSVAGGENAGGGWIMEEKYKSLVTAKHELVDVHQRTIKHANNVNERFALKLLDLGTCESTKIRYKTHSVITEGRQLDDLCAQMWDVNSNSFRFAYASADEGEDASPADRAAGIRRRRSAGEVVRKSPHLMPIPRYLWTGEGMRRENGQKVIGVAMEMIQGRSLTHLLQRLRCPMKNSAALLALEICIKIVNSQRVLHERLDRPLINWDTKPGNIILELKQSPISGRLHCRRAVVVDLGDALPGPHYWFPTRHRLGDTPSYIICTKGYCSPECALLVFLLSSNSRCGSFRKIWYSDVVSIEQLQEARRQRIPQRWRRWVKEGYLRRSMSQLKEGKVDDPQKCPANNTNSPSLPPVSHKPDMTPAPPGPGSASVASPSGAPRAGVASRVVPTGAELRSNSSSGNSDPLRGCWEILFTEKAVVFSTGLVLAQLCGGPNLLQVVQKDEVRALDLLCEWDCQEGVNLLTGQPNIGPHHLLPAKGVFAERPWRDKLSVLLEGCLAFIPTDRWSFRQITTYLNEMYQELHAATYAPTV